MLDGNSFPDCAVRVSTNEPLLMVTPRSKEAIFALQLFPTFPPPQPPPLLNFNSRMMKTKLYRVYSLFCPALLSGRYLTEGNIMQTNSVVTVAPPRPPHENGRLYHVDDRRHDTLKAGELYIYKHV